MYRSPRYWKEMARARKEHEAQMKREAERQAASAKQQAIDETVPYNDIEEAQASSCKRQASSSKLLKP